MHSAADIADLIREFPLAWVCPRADGALPNAALLPLVAELESDGRVRALIGHMARRNPLYAALSTEPRALVLFTGPQGYISPAYVDDSTWAPTWNYAQLRIEAQVRFDPQANDAALATLLAAMERRVPSAWTPADMGARYARLREHIIAFRANVTSLQARFKLGQDESPERLREILARQPDAALARWMRRFNAGRCD